MSIGGTNNAGHRHQPHRRRAGPNLHHRQPARSPSATAPRPATSPSPPPRWPPPPAPSTVVVQSTSRPGPDHPRRHGQRHRPERQRRHGHPDRRAPAASSRHSMLPACRWPPRASTPTGLTLEPDARISRPTLGTQLTLINNTATPAASHPITGTFTNLPQGGTISATLRRDDLLVPGQLRRRRRQRPGADRDRPAADHNQRSAPRRLR